MPYIQGKEVKEGPSGTPANPKLWNLIVKQSQAKFSKNSPARGHWIHAKYVSLGGKFVESKREVDPRLRDYQQEAMDKKEEEQKEQTHRPVKKKVKKNINQIP
jgi:hypothetical protein